MPPLTLTTGQRHCLSRRAFSCEPCTWKRTAARSSSRAAPEQEPRTRGLETLRSRDTKALQNPVPSALHRLGNVAEPVACTDDWEQRLGLPSRIVEGLSVRERDHRVFGPVYQEKGSWGDVAYPLEGTDPAKPLLPFL